MSDLVTLADVSATEWQGDATSVIEFLRPLTSSPALEQAHALVRERCPRIARDRYFAPELEVATALVTGGALSRVFRTLPGLPALWVPA